LKILPAESIVSVTPGFIVTTTPEFIVMEVPNGIVTLEVKVMF